MSSSEPTSASASANAQENAPLDDEESAATVDVGRETPRAQEARLRYAAMARPRSLRKMARQLWDEQQAANDEWRQNVRRAREALMSGLTGEYAEAARAAIRRPEPKVQNEGVILRRLKEWSRLHKWQEYVTQEDQRKAREEQEARQKALQEMHATHAGMARSTALNALGRLGKLMKLDDEQLAEWEADYQRARQRQAEAIERGDWDTANAIEYPKRPRPFVSAYSLVQLAQLGLERERISRIAAIEDAPAEAQAMLPPVVVVNQSLTPPPEPRDPLDEAMIVDAGPPPGATSGLSATSGPTALVSLATRPPADLPADLAEGWRASASETDEDDDDWDDEDEDDDYLPPTARRRDASRRPRRR